MESVAPADTIQDMTCRFDRRRYKKEKEKWVTENIKMRKCSYYIASTERKSEGMCQCGYRKEDHDDDAIDRPKQEQSQQDLKWNFEQHSVTVPTNAFGEIEFVGFIGNNAKFARVDCKTSIGTLMWLMRYIWEIRRPDFIISVIGGEENFNMTSHLRDMFQSLVNLARKDAWIITGGTNIGVAKHVGEAVKYFQLKNIVSIGIAPWGVIHNKQLLVDKKHFEPIQYTIEDKPIEHERILNQYHSHYILVDNGTQHQFETETALRAELELKLNTMTENGTFALFSSVPVVLLVVDGGPNILKRVRNALSNSIPVVIVKGSGGVADLLAFAVTDAEVSESSDRGDKGNAIRKTTKRLTNSQRHCIYNKMRSTKVCETNDIDYNINKIEACLDNIDLISIFELGSGDQDLSETILSAIIKAPRTDLVDQFKRALSLNEFDFARSVILTVDKECKPDSLNDMMDSAILSHNVDFVELLLDNGVDIKTFLTIERLLELYKYSSLDSAFEALLLNMRKKNKKTSTETLSMKQVGQVITHLLDEHYLQQYGSNPDDAPFENPFLHLLIWAVLNNLQDMAKLFWRKGLDSIAAALLAHALFSAMPSRIKKASPLVYEGIEANSREFMDLANGVLDRCYRANEDRTSSLLFDSLLQWEEACCVSIAIKTNNETFIAATACQEVFNKIWMGDMTQENGFLKLLICTFIPPLIPLCVEFGNFDDDIDDIFIPRTLQEEAGVSSPLQPRSQLHKTKHGDESMKHFRRAKIPLFYQAPVVRFLLHVISYMAFLCLYSYVLISKFDQNFSVEDVILIVCVFNIFIDEIWQVIATRHTYTEIKLKAYLADFWNIADILMILLFVVGMILKHLSNQTTLEAARVVLGVNLIICFLRLLQMFSLNKELGPKLVMIIQMVRNLISFLVMLLIFIVGYAIASHAILYPNTEITFNVLRDIFRRPYWNIYGELMLDEIEEGTNNCTNIVELYRNGTQPRCPTESGKYVVPVLMGMYMLMCNILLLNLLISIFSNTYQIVQEKADMHWRVQRYRQMQEYLTRSMYIPFISFIGDIFQIIVFLKTYLSRRKPVKRTSRNVRSLSYLRLWEMTIAQDFFNSKNADLKSIDHSVKANTLRLDQLFIKMDALEEQQYALTATIENARLHPSQTDCVAKSESSTVDEPGSVTLDQRMDNREEQLQWIIDTHKEYKPGDEQARPEKTDERVEVQPFSDEDVPDTVRKWERTIAQDIINSNKADLKGIDDRVKAITLRLDQLFSKMDSLEEQQHALTATIENARLHPSQTDCVAKSESSTVDEPGSVTLDQRMDNREEQIPWIDDTPEDH